MSIPTEKEMTGFEKRVEEFKELTQQISEKEVEILLLKDKRKSLNITAGLVEVPTGKRYFEIPRQELMGFKYVPVSIGNQFLTVGREYTCKLKSGEVVMSTYICTLSDKNYGDYHDFDNPDVHEVLLETFTQEVRYTDSSYLSGIL